MCNKKIIYSIMLAIACIFVITVFAVRKLLPVKMDFKDEKTIVNREIKICTFKVDIYTSDSDTNSNDAWGYDILLNGKLYVHQLCIPAVDGNKCFNSETDARRTADIVAEKIRNNIFPPTVSKEELEYLGVIK